MEDPRLYRRIYTALLERIDGGQLAEGTRLNIGLLADEWDTSRTTVGKALRLLEADGKVQFFRGLGWYVTG
jgi:DNA-binding GntR family transcriptional regulator